MDIYVVTIDSCVMGCATTLKGACDLGAVSYLSALEGKRCWLTANDVVVKLKQVNLNKVSGRSDNGVKFKKK